MWMHTYTHTYIHVRSEKDETARRAKDKLEVLHFSLVLFLSLVLRTF